jgi:hypothetical protein
MESLSRREFAIAAVAAATVGCQSAPPAADEKAATAGAGACAPPPLSADRIATNFIMGDKNEPHTTRLGSHLWMNFYGLVALVERNTKGVAEIVCVNHGTSHQVQLWYRKADNSLGSTTLSGGATLTVEGLDSTHTIKFGVTGEPWSSLDWILDQDRLIPPAERVATTTGAVQADYSALSGLEAYLKISEGEIFAGRPWSVLGGRITWVSKVFGDNDHENTTMRLANGTTDYSMTDNFNWLVKTSGTVKLKVSGSTFEPLAVNNVTRICLTSDLTASEPFSTMLHHCLAYYQLFGVKTEGINLSEVPMPVFSRGVYGEKDFSAALVSVHDPECPTFRIKA